jgi:hypothetical protein
MFKSLGLALTIGASLFVQVRPSAAADSVTYNQVLSAPLLATNVALKEFSTLQSFSIDVDADGRRDSVLFAPESRRLMICSGAIPERCRIYLLEKMARILPAERDKESAIAAIDDRGALFVCKVTNRGSVTCRSDLKEVEKFVTVARAPAVSTALTKAGDEFYSCSFKSGVGGATCSSARPFVATTSDAVFGIFEPHAGVGMLRARDEVMEYCSFLSDGALRCRPARGLERFAQSSGKMGAILMPQSAQPRHQLVGVFRDSVAVCEHAGGLGGDQFVCADEATNNISLETIRAFVVVSGRRASTPRAERPIVVTKPGAGAESALLSFP